LTLDVLAVVVSFNGRDETVRNARALRSQVPRVHIVDNGSDADSLRALDDLRSDPGISVETLGENFGVGHALNRGVARALAEGLTWVLTMDQDTLVEPGLALAFATAVGQNPGAACFASARSDRNATGSVRTVPYAITSGTLVRVSVLDAVGGYDEGFFVDAIDFDLSLRLRSAGHEIRLVPGARIRHQLGESHELRGFAARFYARHAPVRRYYMYRNFLHLAERHVRMFPWFIAKLAVAHLILAVLLGFFDPRPRESYQAIVRGLRDYRAGTLGRYPAGQ
jgi:rhamnosyltransferase